MDKITNLSIFPSWLYKLKIDWFYSNLTSLLLAPESHTHLRVWLSLIGEMMKTVSIPNNRQLKSLMSISDIQRFTGKSRSTIYRWIAAGSFPAPVKVYSSSLWPEESLAEWRQQVINGQFCTTMMKPGVIGE